MINSFLPLLSQSESSSLLYLRMANFVFAISRVCICVINKEEKKNGEHSVQVLLCFLSLLWCNDDCNLNEFESAWAILCANANPIFSCMKMKFAKAKRDAERRRTAALWLQTGNGEKLIHAKWVDGIMSQVGTLLASLKTSMEKWKTARKCFDDFWVSK